MTVSRLPVLGHETRWATNKPRKVTITCDGRAGSDSLSAAFSFASFRMHSRLLGFHWNHSCLSHPMNLKLLLSPFYRQWNWGWNRSVGVPQEAMAEQDTNRGSSLSLPWAVILLEAAQGNFLQPSPHYRTLSTSSDFSLEPVCQLI